MQHIQIPRIYGHETGVRYLLNFKDNVLIDNLVACFLIAKNQDLIFESLTISTNQSSSFSCFKKKDIDEIKSVENFISQIPKNITSWHLQMKRNNYPISFGSCCNKEIGCTYHHWCLIDVDSFIEDIEKQVTSNSILL